MHVLYIVIGLLLMLFGGGCTVIVGGIFISDPNSILNDIASIFPLYLLVGLAPLAGGFFLFRHGLRIDRQKRQAAREAIADKDKT